MTERCKHCGAPITFDDWCHVHDDTGFADCGLKIEGGTLMPAGDLTLRINPTITKTSMKTTYAEPMEEQHGFQPATS